MFHFWQIHHTDKLVKGQYVVPSPPFISAAQLDCSWQKWKRPSGKKHNEFVHHLDKLNLQHGVSYGRKKIQYQSLIWFSKNSKTNVIFSHTKIIYFATELLERSTKLKAPKNRTVTRSISNVINRSEERPQSAEGARPADSVLCEFLDSSWGRYTSFNGKRLTMDEEIPVCTSCVLSNYFRESQRGSCCC